MGYLGTIVKADIRGWFRELLLETYYSQYAGKTSEEWLIKLDNKLKEKAYQECPGDNSGNAGNL